MESKPEINYSYPECAKFNEIYTPDRFLLFQKR